MAIKPTKVAKPESSSLQGQKILSAAYANATDSFKQTMPKIDWRDPSTITPDNLHVFGSTLMQDCNKIFRNEFLNYLLNRIAATYVSSALYENPLSFLKRGVLELGEFIEDVFVDLCDPHDYDPEVAEQKVFAREQPNVYATLYSMNYQKYYKQTVNTADLRQAFLSWQGISDLVVRITTAMYTSANYDEYVTTKWMLANLIINGEIKAEKIDTVTNTNMDSIAEFLRMSSSNLTFMSPEYNRAHVHTFTDFENQYLFVDSRFEAKMDVQVLASAFNLSKADFLAKRVLVDGFGNLDIGRLTKLFSKSDGFVEPDKDTLDALNQIPAILVDKDFILIYDNLMEYGSVINPEGLYENFTLHQWKTFASSPFKNAKMFLPFEQTVDLITVAPNTATVSKGQKIVFTTDITTTGFASKKVVWSVSDNTSNNTSIVDGVLTVGIDEGAVTLTVKATSYVDDTKSGTATVTVAGNS